MKRCLLLSFLSAASAWAQPGSLGTDRTGSTLYFVSAHQRVGTEDQPHGKIFLWRSSGGSVEVALQRERIIESSSEISWFTNQYDIDYVSASGGLLSFRARGEWLVRRQGGQSFVSTVLDGQGESLFRDQLVFVDLSRKGDFYLVRTESAPATVRRVGSPMQIGVPAASVSSNLPRAMFVSRQAISDSGQVVYQCTGLCLVTGAGPPVENPPNPVNPNFRTAVTRRIPTTAEPIVPAISANGETVIYESMFQEGQLRRLFSVDVRSGRETLLFVDGYPDRFLTVLNANPAPMFGATIDDAGHRVLLMVRETEEVPRQWLLAVNSDGSEAKWFGFAPEGYREAILSGDGNVVFAVTANGRIVRYDLRQGVTVNILTRVPFISGFSWPSGSPGAVTKIFGGGFSDGTITADEFPAPAELGGYRVGFHGRSFPILEVSPTQVTFQIPWELQPDSSQPLDLIPPAKDEMRAPPRSFSISSPGSANPDLPVRHADGRPVTLSDPARSREEILVLASGFAIPRGVTGEPPAAPVDNRRELLRCAGGEEVLFYGFAVGKIGLYELRLRLPELGRSGPAPAMRSTSCTGAAGSLGFLIPVAP